MKKQNLTWKVLLVLSVLVLLSTILVVNAFADTTPVAQIGESNYTSLESAFAAAKTGDTVKLLQNVNLGITSEKGTAVGSWGKKASLVVPTNVSITLDMNGKTLEADGSGDHYLFYVPSSSSLTITGSGTIDYSASSWDGILFYNDGTATIDGNASNLSVKIGYLYGSGSGTTRFQSGKYNKSVYTSFYDSNNYEVVGSEPYEIKALQEICTVDGVVYKTISAAITAAQTANKPIVLIANANCSGITSDVTFAQSNFTLTSTSTISKGTYNCPVVTTSISGGVFNSSVTASSTISGGTFNGTVTANSDISGGTFNVPVTAASSISGGTFNYAATAGTFIAGGTFKSTATATTTISGGIFEVDPVGTIYTGKVKVVNDNGNKWLVTDSKNVENGKVITGSFYKYYSVSEFAETTTHTVLTANSYSDFVVLTDDVDQNGKLYKGAYSFPMSNVFADGYSYIYSSNFYFIGKNGTSDSSYKLDGGTFHYNPTSYAVDCLAQGYEVVDNQDGTYTIQVMASAIVAKIGDVGYPSLKKAINAATAGVTVKLQKDLSENIDLYRYYGPYFTLDLNGHSIIVETGKALSVAGFDLQITDSIGTGIVKGEIALYIGGSSSSVKETITIKGGTFEGSEYAVYLEGYSVSNTANIIIENGYFKGSFKSYRNSSDTGDYFKGLATFKGGNYTENLNSFAKCSNPTSTSYLTGGFAYFPTGYSVVEDELAEYRYKVQEVTYEVSAGSCEHGSVLIDGKTSFDIKAGTKVTITSTPDADYKLKTYKVNGVAIDGDTFNVTEDSVVTAEFIAKEYIIQNTTTGAKYETITEAAEAAQSGDTIKLLRSCSFDKSQGLTNEAWHWDHTFENITLDLNNKTLYLTGSAQLKVAGKNILIKRGTINSTHNYAIETDQYNPTVETVEASTITLDNVIMNAGVNCQATQLNVRDCNIDATNKKYYAFYLSSGCKPNNITIESGKYTAGTQTVFSLENNSQIVKLSGGLYGSEPTDAMLATGFAVMTNKDDSTSTKYPYKVSKYIVEIVETSVKYDHVGEALDAALDGQTVRLLSDTTLYGLVDSTFTDDKTVTFDLNGKVWKLNTETQAWQHAIRLTGTGTLIVKDSSQAKTGAMIYDSEYGSCKMFTVNVNSNVNIVIESGTFTTTGSGTTIECGGDLTIYDGTITGVSCSGNFTMLGGTIGSLSMFSASGKNATIRGGTIEHSFTLPYSGDGVNVFISGGTIGNISNQNDDGINNSVVITGGNITWLQPGGTTLITGGTFTNLNGGHFTIEGGNFTNLFFHNITEEEWLADPNALSYRDSTYCITGGTFATTNYIVDKTARTIESDIDGRYFASKKANGLWVVELKDTVTVVTNPDGNKEVTVEVNYGETTVSAGSTGATTSGTNVSGVELSKNKTVENDTKTGLQQVIENAKTKAGATSNFTKAVEADTNKIIDVEVKVKVTVNQMVVEIANKTIVYDVTPSATVKVITINNDTETVEEVKEVTVTNEMIDQKQDIVVELYSDFAPVQIIHKDDDGKIIGVYNQGDFTYDETTHLVKVIVHHFSTLTLVGSDNEKANAVAEIKGGAQYDSLDAALAEAKKTQDSVVIKLLTDIHYSGEKILVIQSNVALNLNGFSITGLDDITVNGKVVDTSPAKGVLSAQSYTFDESNCVYTPIYDNAHSGYSFFRLSIKSVITREKENDDGLNVQFALKKNSTYTVERNAALELLAKSSSRVKATITISWGNKTVSYPFSQGEMAEFCNTTTAKAFSAHIVGLNAIEAGTVLKITVSLTTYNADGATRICSLASDLYATSSKTNAQVTFANTEDGTSYDVNTPPTFTISEGAKYKVQYICSDKNITIDDNYTAPVVNGYGWRVVVTVLDDDNYNAGVFTSNWFRALYTPTVTFSNTTVGQTLSVAPTYSISPEAETTNTFTDYVVTVKYECGDENIYNVDAPQNNGKGWKMVVKISYHKHHNLEVTVKSNWFYYVPETN